MDAYRPHMSQSPVLELPDPVQMQNWRQIEPKGEVHPLIDYQFKIYESVSNFRKGICSGNALTKLRTLFGPSPKKIEPQTENMTLNVLEGKPTTAPNVESKVRKEVERIEKKDHIQKRI